MILDASVTVTV